MSGKVSSGASMRKYPVVNTLKSLGSADKGVTVRECIHY